MNKIPKKRINAVLAGYLTHKFRHCEHCQQWFPIMYITNHLKYRYLCFDCIEKVSIKMGVCCVREYVDFQRYFYDDYLIDDMNESLDKFGKYKLSNQFPNIQFKFL